MFLVGSAPALAATGINRKMNFQGKLVNNGALPGTNVTDGNYTVRFTLWDALSAGNSLWTEVWNSGTTQVAVSNGIFSVALGTYATFPPAVDFNTDNIYLSIGVSSDADMTPRIQFTAVPYAFNAEKASGQSLSITDSVAFGSLGIGGSVVVTGNLEVGATANLADLYLTGKLGVGTSAPGAKMEVFDTSGSGGTLLKLTTESTSNIGGYLELRAGTRTVRFGADSWIGPHFGSTEKAGFMFLDDNSVSPILGLSPSNGNVDLGNASYRFRTVYSVGMSASGNVSASGNLMVGSSVVFTNLPMGTGTTTIFLDSLGNLVKGTLPETGFGKSRIVILSPEYSGAVFTADGSGTTDVSITSDNTLNSGGVGWKNYYELSSTSGSLQDYSVLVRVTLPSDFATWETGTCPGSTCALELNYQTGVGTTGDNAVSYIVSNDIDTPGTAVCSVGNTASTSWGSAGCTEAVLNDNVVPEWDAAGETAVVRVKMAAKSTSNALTRSGDIILRYRSRF